MINKTNYILTPLMEQISKCISQQHPRAFIIADRGDGNGPILGHQGHHVRVTTLSIDLKQGSQHIKLSHLSQPPYLIAVALERSLQPLLIVLYREGPKPIFEHSNEDGLIGQVLAYSKAPDGTERTLAQALCLPKAAHVFAPTSIRDSILLEEHPELCDHLLLCSATISFLLNQSERSDLHGT